MHLDLRGMIAIVTGANRGIGRSISLALGACGAHVVLAARNKKLLKKVETEITSIQGKATSIQTDISLKRNIDLLFRSIKERWGKLDILVNNAAVGIFGKMADFRIEDFDKIMKVNLRGVYICCQEALKIMVPSGSGYIINISSMQGVKAYPNQSAYAASKHGVMGMTKSLATEVQKYGIRVSAILPGGVDTDLIRRARPDLDTAQLIPPEDIAQTVLYLLSLSDKAMVDQIIIRRRTALPF